MTATEAKSALQRPLQFGDRAQINAVKFLAQVEELLERMKDGDVGECEECDGTGYTECCECGQDRECEDCDGTGEDFGEIADAYPPDVRRAAISQWNRQK
jgi:RecJ-like exonuclease